MKRALLAAGAALLLGAATFTTSIVTASSADARPGARSGMGGGPRAFSGGGHFRAMGAGPSRFGAGPSKFSGGPVKFGGPSKFSGPGKFGGGKVHFKDGWKGKHHVVHHRRFHKHRAFFAVGVGYPFAYAYSAYDECIRWHPAYGWINVCYDYDY